MAANQSNYANIALNCTTLATGVVIGTASQISKCQLFTQVTTATTTNNSLNLPINPSPKDVYYVRNDGAVGINVFPGNAGSSINGLGAGNALFVLANQTAQFVCVSNTQASPPVLLWLEFAITGTPRNVAISAVSTLSPQQSGCVFSVTTGAGYVINLPAVANNSGVLYVFHNAANGGKVDITGPAGTLQGDIVQGPVGAPLSVVVANKTSISFAAVSAVGDLITCECDGVNWYVQGVSTIAVGVICA